MRYFFSFFQCIHTVLYLQEKSRYCWCRLHHLGLPCAVMQRKPAGGNSCWQVLTLGSAPPDGTLPDQAAPVGSASEKGRSLFLSLFYRCVSYPRYQPTPPISRNPSPKCLPWLLIIRYFNKNTLSFGRCLIEGWCFYPPLCFESSQNRNIFLGRSYLSSSAWSSPLRTKQPVSVWVKANKGDIELTQQTLTPLQAYWLHIVSFSCLFTKRTPLPNLVTQFPVLTVLSLWNC